MTKNNKKIAIIYPYLPNYRIPFFQQLQQELQSRNIDLTIYSGSNFGRKKVKEADPNTGLSIVKQERIGFSFLRFEVQWQKGLLKTVSKEKPDLFIFMYNAGILNYSALMLRLSFSNKPYYIWTSGHKRFGLSKSQHKIKDYFKSIFTSRAAGIISYSSYFKKKLISEGYDAEKIFVSQNTVNVEKIIQKYPYQHIQRTYKTVKFLFVGNVIQTKQLDQALLAFKDLKEQGSKFTFDIVGDGYFLNELKKISSQLQLEDCVNFHGAKFGKDVEHFFLQANVFLLPGTGGLAINEALAYGLPVITTPGDGTAFDLIDGNGFLLDFDYTQEQIQNAINHFLSLNITEFKKMENASIELVKNKCLQSNMVNGFLSPITRELSHENFN